MKQKLEFIVFLFFPVIFYGQVTVLSDVNTKEAKINEPIVLTIVQEIFGENFEQQTPLRMPDLSKFDILGNASEQNTFIDQKKGIRVNQIVYQWYLQPKQPGKVKIGSALVTVNGKIYKSEPFDIVVKDIKTEGTDYLAREVYLNLEVEDKIIYENQPTVAVLRAYSKNFDNFRKVENIQIPQQNNVNIRAVSYQKQDIEPSENGDVSSQVIAVFVIFPEKAGNVEIAPVSAMIKTPEINKILSNKVKLNVKTLPKNSPKDFKNAVGKFDVKIENLSKENHVELNKPTDVLVKVSGIGNLDVSKLPNIIESENYTFFKPKITTKLSTQKNGVNGEISAKYILIPKKVGKIPVELEGFSFFNPDSNKYIDLGVKSVVLDVLNEEQIADTKSTLDMVNDYTKNVLVEIPVVQQEEKTKKIGINWGFILKNFVLFAAATLLVFLFFRRKNTNKLVQNPITTISEEEEKLKERIKPDLSTYLEYLKNLKNNHNYSEFFSTYEELHSEVSKQISEDFGINIKTYVERNRSSKFSEEFSNIQHLMQIEKYAPVHDSAHIEELYERIVTIYSQITK